MIYVISDLHGYPLKKTKDLLKEAGFTSSDFLYVLGDVIDRGDEGIKTLLWIMQKSNVELLLGNHEAMLIACDFLFSQITDDFIKTLSLDDMNLLENWRRNGGKKTIKDMLKLSPETRLEIVDFVKDCRKFAFVTVGESDFLLVHAGLGNYREGKKLSSYHLDELVWVRPNLEDEYSKQFTTIFGHTPTIYYGKEHKRKVVKTPTWIDVDTGASCGLEATLIRLDDLTAYTYNEDGEITSYKI